jgi:branched-chain amino acid transport system substrate-binding protein
MKHRHARALRSAAALVAATALLAGCGGRGDSGSETPGVTDDTITIGSSYPLSGPLAANGTAAMTAAKAYFDAVNAEGGVTMADGKTRKIDFTYYDDGYDPAKAVQNYQKLTTQDDAFALFQTFGTAPNLAMMKQANAQEVPQLFVHSGASVFSAGQDEFPWTVGWQPTYETEGVAFGDFLTARDEPVKVAVIAQNDDLGEAFVNGFKDAIDGSQVTIVGEQTYEPSDPTLDSQVSQLASTDADVLFQAVAIPKLAAGAMTKADELGWKPENLLVSLVSSTDQVVKPSGLDGSTGIFSTAFLKAADDPQWADDEDVQQYVDRVEATDSSVDPTVPNATWGYAAAATLVQALEESDPTRDSLMDAIRGVSGSVPLMLPGLELAPSSTTPALQDVNVQEFKDGAWSEVP